VREIDAKAARRRRLAFPRPSTHSVLVWIEKHKWMVLYDMHKRELDTRELKFRYEGLHGCNLGLVKVLEDVEHQAHCFLIGPRLLQANR
jgi:hypothetical protein